MDMKKIAPYLVGVALVAGGAGFFGGTTYAKSKTVRGGRTGQFVQFQGGPGGGGQFQGRTGGNVAFRGAGGGFVTGEILDNDGKTMTIKLRDGGSKIVFLADSTEISKSASGDASDLTVGANVMVAGKANDDGSVTAQSVQLRPMMPAPGPVTDAPQK